MGKIHQNINSAFSGNNIPGDLPFLCFLLLIASFIIIFLQKVKNMYAFNINQKKGFKWILEVLRLY